MWNNIDLMSFEYKNYEWVAPEASGRRGGYWRRIPYTRMDPTKAQVAHRLHFSRIAALTRGLKGTEILSDGRELSRSALLIGELLQRSNQQEEIYPRLTPLPPIRPNDIRFYSSSTIVL